MQKINQTPVTWKSWSPWAPVTPVQVYPCLLLRMTSYTGEIYICPSALQHLLAKQRVLCPDESEYAGWQTSDTMMWFFRRNKRGSVHSHTLVCQRASKQWAGIRSALPAVSEAAPLCFRWDPEVIHTEAAQPLLSSCATGRAGILPGGALGASLLPTPGGRQLPALPAEVSLVPAQENDRLKTSTMVQSSALLCCVLCAIVCGNTCC